MCLCVFVGSASCCNKANKEKTKNILQVKQRGTPSLTHDPPTHSKASRALTDAHVTFITMPDTAQGAKKHLRVGGQSKILMFNRETDDATLPDLSPQGIATSAALPANSWQCLEYHLGPDGTLETWLNDKAVAGLTSKAGVANPNAAQWQRSSIKPKVSGVYFGWESYGGDANTFWYDDVAISSQRVGCGNATVV